ncbi:MAG: hypothetical protein KC583_19815, partial [Myxococcales bacterium]|nr:hypothetical protein [Myxococcales bacterium]
MAIAVLGCQPQGGGGSKCVAGATSPCPCPGGGQAVQVCDDTGRFGACPCGPQADAGPGAGGQPGAGG